MGLRLQGLIFTVATAFMLAALPAGATTVTTTSYTQWKTNLTGAPVADDNFPTSSCSTCSTSVGLNLNGYIFTGPDGLGGFSLAETSSGPAGLIASSNSGASINVATPADGTNAFLVSVGTTGGTPITLSLSDGQSFTLSAGLFGVALSHDITSFSLSTTSGSQLFINDFFLGSSNLTQDGSGGGTGTPAATPEGSTVALLAGGLLVMFGAKKKLA